MNGQSHGIPHGQSHGGSHGYLAATVGAKTRHRTTRHHIGPEHLLWLAFHHDVAVGNARVGDDMDAATRRRFA